MQRTTFDVFIAGFILWWNELNIEKSPAAVRFMEIITEISVRIVDLIKRSRDNNSMKQLYEFRCKADIAKFISAALELEEKHAKAAYIIKALLLAHKDYTKEKLYDPNTKITKYHFYYTIMYHCWATKGQIPARRCIIIKRI